MDNDVRKFETGAVRNPAAGKGRPDLLPYRAEIEVSKLFEKGAVDYAPRNWEKGIPVREFVNSARRHLAGFMTGEVDTKDSHLVAFAWNAMCMLDTVLRIKDGILPPSLMDQLPFTKIKLMNDIMVDISPEDNNVIISDADGKSVTKNWDEQKSILQTRKSDKLAAKYAADYIVSLSKEREVKKEPLTVLIGEDSVENLDKNITLTKGRDISLETILNKTTELETNGQKLQKNLLDQVEEQF